MTVYEPRSQENLAEYLTVGEAASFLGVSTATLRNWDKCGKFPTLRHPKNGYRIYRREDLESILQAEGCGDRLSDRLMPVLDWSDVAESEHFVQFYESDAFLVSSVSRFLGAALGAGDGTVLIATRAHRAAIQRKLRARGLNLPMARARGQFVSLDAAEILARIMVDGTLEPGRFREVIGKVIAGVAAVHPRVRAFGEMVALLWASGERDAAIRLEELWNDLQNTHSFALYCAYLMHGFVDEGNATTCDDVYACHSRVIPAESYTSLPDEGERLEAIARLQRKARALEAEISRRREVEARLVALQEQRDAELADLKRLQEMSARLSTGLELAPILEETIRTAAALVGTDRGLLSLCDPEQEGLRLGASLGFDDDLVRLIESVPPGGGARGMCLQERRRIVVEDVETDPLFEPYREAARQAGFRAVHSTPMVTRSGRVIGVLSTHFRERHCPSDREMHLIDLCARQAVDFIENARLYRRAQEEIAERKRVEGALRASQQHLEAVVETTPECVKLVDSEGRLVAMNAAGLAMIEAEGPEGVFGRSIYSLIAAEFVEAFQAFHERVSRGERGTLEFDIIGLRGTRRCMETHAASLRNPADGRLLQLAITRDITKRKRTEAARREADRRKDEFLATLAHELRNPWPRSATHCKSCTWPGTTASPWSRRAA